MAQRSISCWNLLSLLKYVAVAGGSSQPIDKLLVPGGDIGVTVHLLHIGPLARGGSKLSKPGLHLPHNTKLSQQSWNLACYPWMSIHGASSRPNDPPSVHVIVSSRALDAGLASLAIAT